MSFLDALPERYRLILCDIWGVVHDGVNLYPGAAERLLQWRGEGRTIVLITNAPRTAEAVEQQLGQIGLPRDAWDGTATSGEAGIAALLATGHPVGFIGTRADRAILEGRNVAIAGGRGFHGARLHRASTTSGDMSTIIAEQLEALADRDVLIHCLNPDRVVVRGGVPEPCAGALADVYLGLGGRVEWYGKPLPGDLPARAQPRRQSAADEVLAVGDALQTDILGAAKMGFDAIFVAGGIHAGETFPPDFGPQNGLGDWQPVAVVDSLR